MSLAEARGFVRDRMDDGVTCPCCEKFVKRYVLKINSTIAAWLVALVRLTNWGATSVHASKASAQVCPPGKSAVGYAYLRHWGLIVGNDEPEAAEGAKPGKNGHWMPTEMGLAFVRGEERIRKRVVMLNGIPQGFDGEPITIRDALGSRFDYAELMAARPEVILK